MPLCSARLMSLSAVTLTAALLAGCAASGSPEPLARQDGLNATEQEHIAAAAEASGDEQLALAMYAKAAAEVPASATAQLRYADLLTRLGKVGDARQVLATALARSPDSLDLKRALGTLDVLAGHGAAAIGELDAVLLRHPRDLRAMVNKAVALDLLGRHDEAQQLYRAARAASPEDPAIANDLALSLALQGKLSESRSLLASFRAAGNSVPERMETTMRVLAAAGETGGTAAATAGDDDTRRLALALVSDDCSTCGHGTASP